MSMQEASQDISFNMDHAMEQSNELLVADGSHYDTYDHGDQGPHPEEDMNFYMPTDQGQEDKAAHILEETKNSLSFISDMEYFSRMKPVETSEPVDFIMDPVLDISESATPVATTIGITPKRENGSSVHTSTDSQAQRALASALASSRSNDIKKARGVGASRKPKSGENSVRRRIDTSLFNRNKAGDCDPGDRASSDSKDEDCHTDSADDDKAATILPEMKRRGYTFQRDTTPLPESPKPPAPSPPTQSQSTLSCSVCDKTFRRPSEMA